MSPSEELRQFKNYGEAILQKIQEYKSVKPSELLKEEIIFTELHNRIERLQQEAQKLVTRVCEPVKIAVMGEMKASKTTIIGSLLGYAGILPISEVAATGNVTYLRIIQTKGKQETSFEFTVKYFNKAEAKDCFNFMLDKLRKKAKASDVQLLKEQLDKLSLSIYQEPNFWQQFIDWCQEVKNFSTTPGLNKAITELEVFAKACNEYGDIVDGKFYSIDADTAQFGLKLPSDPTTIQKQNFDQIPPQKEQLPEFLKATFPLIRHIDVEVKVSEIIWNLSFIQGEHKIILLDFPGIGAADSALRDQFLSQYEMDKVDIILLLTSGPQPGSTRDDEIFDMLRQKRSNESLVDNFIVVGVGRFDELSARSYFDDLISDNNSEKQLTEETVIQKIPALQKAIKSARALTQGNDERIVLLSAFVALDKMQQEFSTIKFASPEIFNKLIASDFKENSTLLLEKWKQLSQILKKSQPDSILANWLEAFCEDGGIGRLRRLLKKHIEEHGLKQLHKDASDQVRIVCAAQKNLEQIINQPSFKKILVDENKDIRTLQKTIREIINAYNTLKTVLERNPLELKTSIDKFNGANALKVVIEEKVTSEFFGWRQWRDLFNKVQKDGTILNKEEKSLITRSSRRNSAERKSTNFTTTDDFYPTFEKSVEKLIKFTSDVILQAIEKVLTELSSEQVNLQDGKITVDLPRLVNQFNNCLKKPESENRVLDNLLYSINPVQWKDEIIENLNARIYEEFGRDNVPYNDTLTAVKEETPRIDPEEEFKRVCLLTSRDPKNLFPLALKDEESNRVGQTLPWSPNKKYPLKSQENHLVLLLQMRQAMIDSVNEELIGLVNKVNIDFNDILKTILEESIPELQELLNHENNAKLREIVTGELQEKEVVYDWLEYLEEVVLINCFI
jgi:hypothetical protein